MFRLPSAAAETDGEDRRLICFLPKSKTIEQIPIEKEQMTINKWLNTALSKRSEMAWLENAP